MEDAVERALVGQRTVRIDADEIDAARFQEIDKRLLDEALLLLGRERVPDSEPS